MHESWRLQSLHGLIVFGSRKSFQKLLYHDSEAWVNPVWSDLFKWNEYKESFMKPGVRDGEVGRGHLDIPEQQDVEVKGPRPPMN